MIALTLDPVSELMSPKSRYPATTSRPRKPSITLFPGRDGLGAYVQHPESFPPSRVIYHTDDFVAINDLYPKSSVHTLLLPRDRSKNLLHAFDAFEDTEFLASVQAEVKKLRQMVATELRRKYGRFSDQEKAREEAMGAYPPPDELPSGRDWEKDVISGIHSRPSMNHLHIHVLSVDRFSECMKHRKHYNSFATPFLVAVEDFPLAKDDVRRHPGREGYLNSDLKCWRCGENFGHKFASLKQHLAEEFEQWKKV